MVKKALRSAVGEKLVQYDTFWQVWISIRVKKGVMSDDRVVYIWKFLSLLYA